MTTDGSALATPPAASRALAVRADAVMRAPIATVAAASSLREVAEELAADEIGLVLVGRPSRPEGVISERDLVSVVGYGADLDRGQAVEIMTVDVVAAPRDASLAEVVDLMAGARVRHVVVTDDDGHACGVVSARDVLDALAGLS